LLKTEKLKETEKVGDLKDVSPWDPPLDTELRLKVVADMLCPWLAKHMSKFASVWN